MTGSATEESTAWERTLAEADEMATELREAGWEVLVVRAGHVAPIPPGEAEDGRSGLVYVAPDSVGSELPALLERGEFDRYETFRRQVGSDLFLLTSVTAPDADTAVLLVGAIDLGTAQPLIDAARERGELHSHVRLLDGTHLATVHHEDPDHFFPG